MDGEKAKKVIVGNLSIDFAIRDGKKKVSDVISPHPADCITP